MERFLGLFLLVLTSAGLAAEPEIILERTYGQWYQLVFHAFVTDLDDGEKLALEDQLAASLKGLRGDAFRTPTAGWLVGNDEIPTMKLLGASGRTMWSCTERDRNEHATFAFPLEGGYTIGNAPDVARGVACHALLQPLDERSAEIHRTGIHVDELAIVRVTMSSDWYPGSNDDRAPHVLPEVLGYSKETLDENQSAGSGYTSKDGRVESVESWGGVRRKASLGPVDLEPPTSTSTSWVSRWRIERVKRRYGRQATEERLAVDESLILQLPIAEVPAETDRIEPPEETWLDNVRRDLELQSSVSVDGLWRAFRSEVQSRGPQRDWLILFCRPDGSGHYGLSGFTSRYELSNARQVCDAAYRLYAER